MGDQPDKYLIIDEQGYPMFGELRVADIDVGASLLKNIKRTDVGTFTTTWQDDTYLVENFDDPLVIQSVEKPNGKMIAAKFPYDLTLELNLQTIYTDEWDRFHLRTQGGVPAVFSRKAQAMLFDLLDEYDDDSITVAGKRIQVPQWFEINEDEDVDVEDFWTGLYNNNDTPWELDAPAAALEDMLPRLKMPKSRILVLGSGTGNDAAFFAKSGHIVTAVDFSEEAINRAKQKYSNYSNITWVQGDLFELPKNFTESFDLIYEYTCYCAVDPERRNEMVKVWNRCLTPRGYLMGIFFVHDRPLGPPWGGTEWELRERLKKYYDFRFWGRWRQSIPKRKGFELFVYAQKK